MNTDLCFLCSTDGWDRIPMVDLLPGQWAMGRTRNSLDGLTVKFGAETFHLTVFTINDVARSIRRLSFVSWQFDR
jgi:hypothetical protein